MTADVSGAGGATRQGFDELVAEAVAETYGSTSPSRRRWPVAGVILLLVGSACLASAALVPQSDGAGRAAADASSTVTPASAASSSPTPTSSPDSASGSAVSTPSSSPNASTPIAELADAEWVARIADAADIPARAVAAYAGASIAVDRLYPGCGLGWNTLAAIGYVESEHASMGDATLLADGTVTPAIVGVALDGTGGYAAIADTDDGALDGDATWDHAVGPFQFIPSTWELAAQDGNGDGVADVNQIDDAALAAAVHLCQVGGDLTQDANWIAAIGAYNASTEYNHRVAAAAEYYAFLS